MSKRKLKNDIRTLEYDKVLRLCEMFNFAGVESDIIPNVLIPPDNYIFIPEGQNFVITNLDTEQEIPRITVNYNLRNRIIGDDLRAFIEKIIRCIEEYLRTMRKHIIHITQGGKEAYVIVDTSVNEISWTPNKNDAQVTFSISAIDKDDKSTFPPNFKTRINQIVQTLPNSQTIKQLHIGWVNGMAPIGEQTRIPGLGLLILFYAILQSYLQHKFLIKGSLDNDSDHIGTYKGFGFSYDSGVNDNKISPEMSSSLNIEKIINDILPVICGMHSQICDCIYSTAGGKRRRTKRRKTKRRKTRRRRKY